MLSQEPETGRLGILLQQQELLSTPAVPGTPKSSLTPQDLGSVPLQPHYVMPPETSLCKGPGWGKYLRTKLATDIYLFGLRSMHMEQCRSRVLRTFAIS